MNELTIIEYMGWKIYWDEKQIEASFLMSPQSKKINWCPMDAKCDCEGCRAVNEKIPIEVKEHFIKVARLFNIHK